MKRWFEHEHLALVVGVAVAVGAYLWRGGHYPLPVDLMAVGAIGLAASVGVRQLVLRARFRAEDEKAGG